MINGVAFLVFAAGTLAAVRLPRFSWFAVSFAALLGLNGALHTLATLGMGRYSPGTLTGLVLYFPLSWVVLRISAVRLPAPVFGRSVLFGVFLHAVVALIAFA